MTIPIAPSVYAVIGGYVGLLVVMGVVMRRLNHDLSDYFRNGCRGTWWLVGASAFMTSFSAGTFTGIAGIAFGAGWTVTLIFAANALGFLANYAFLAAWFRQLRAVTSPEVINMRFGPATQQTYAWIGVLSRLLYAAMQLYGLGLFGAAIFGFPIHAVIWITGGVVMLLSAVGGSWAITSSDFLQSLVLIPSPSSSPHSPSPSSQQAVASSTRSGTTACPPSSPSSSPVTVGSPSATTPGPGPRRSW